MRGEFASARVGASHHETYWPGALAYDLLHVGEGVEFLSIDTQLDENAAIYALSIF